MARNKHNSQAYIEELSAQLMSANGDRQAAVASLCLAFEPLVQSLAARYEAQAFVGADREDLEQEARRGLLEACQTFDRNKGAFASHAMWRIRSALSGYVQRLENPVRLPTALVHELPKLRRTIVALSHRLKRDATMDEVSVAMALPMTAITAMLAYEDGGISLMTTIGNVHSGNGGTATAAYIIESYESPWLNPEEILLAKEEYKGEE